MRVPPGRKTPGSFGMLKRLFQVVETGAGVSREQSCRLRRPYPAALSPYLTALPAVSVLKKKSILTPEMQPVSEQDRLRSCVVEPAPGAACGGRSLFRLTAQPGPRPRSRGDTRCLLLSTSNKNNVDIHKSLMFRQLLFLHVDTTIYLTSTNKQTRWRQCK